MNENIEKKFTQLSPYWMWKNEISSDVIGCLDKELSSLKLEKAKTFLTAEKGDDFDETRNNDIVMIDPMHWFAGSLYNVARQSNVNAEWNYNISFPEVLQISYYDVGQYYDWHQDMDLLLKLQFDRKLTAICLLSDTSEFEGGDLEIEEVGKINLNKGDIIVFPSFIKHRVTPVTKGVRKSAVVWALGVRTW
jgi:PKHD-type hydroxylase